VLYNLVLNSVSDVPTYVLGWLPYLVVTVAWYMMHFVRHFPSRGHNVLLLQFLQLYAVIFCSYLQATRHCCLRKSTISWI